MDADNGRDRALVSEPTVSTSLEHLVAGSQGVISKRIDLALLEGKEVLSRALESAFLLGAAILMALAAWSAGAAAMTMSLVEESRPILRLVVFGALQASAAVVLVLLAVRQGRALTRERSE